MALFIENYLYYLQRSSYKSSMVIFLLGIKSVNTSLKSLALDAEPDYCKFIDCAKIKSTECRLRCATYDWCKRVVDCSEVGAEQICPVVCGKGRKDNNIYL